MAKRIFWLKLHDSFFRDVRVKALLRQPGGNEAFIIFLKLFVESLRTEGTIYSESIAEEFTEELAILIDEDKEKIERAMQLLTKHRLITLNDSELVFVDYDFCVGSESDSAKRVRKHREMLQSNNDVTESNNDVTFCNDIKRREDKKREEKNNNVNFIINLYHEKCPSLPKVSKITDKRRSLIEARLKDYSIEDIKNAFILSENSDFLRNGKDTWKGASFDWILNPNNIVKILEGNYSSDIKQIIPPAKKERAEDNEREEEILRIFEDCKENYPSDLQTREDYKYFLNAIASDSFDKRKAKALKIKSKIRSMTEEDRIRPFREVLLC